jgi:hypothetical protein
MSRFLPLAVAVVLSVCAVACGSASDSPTAPSATLAAPLGSQGLGSNASIRAAGTTHGQALTAVVGAGSGIVNVTPTAAAHGSFSAQINVNVHGAPPNTTFFVQRAPEIGRPNSADGVCQRAAGDAPWGPPAPNFVTFPLPATGPLVTLQTSQGGAGSVHIDFGALSILDGTQFDVMFRLVDDLTNPSNDLRTGCFTVTVK